MENTQSKEVHGPGRLTTEVNDVQDMIDFFSSLIKRSQYHRRDMLYVKIGDSYVDINNIEMVDDRIIMNAHSITNPFDDDDE